MKTVQEWLDDYSVSHKNPRNKALHWLCVPPIVLSVVGFLRPLQLGDAWLNVAMLALVLTLAYYAVLSWRLALGMVPVFAVMYLLCDASFRNLGKVHLPLMAAVFVLAWIGQFIGHQIEGKKPSFFKDIQFLMIGPLWLLADLYRRLDLSIKPNKVAHG